MAEQQGVNAVFRLILQNTLGMSVMILVLLLGRPLLEKRFRPQLRYAAWVIVALGLLLPFGLAARPLLTVSAPASRSPIVVETPAPVSGERLLEATTAPQPTGQEAMEMPQNGAAVQPTPRLTAQPVDPLYAGQKEEIHFQWPDAYTLGMLLWALGGAGMLAVQCIRHIRFFRRVRRWKEPPAQAEQRVLQEEAAALDLRRPVPLFRCAAVPSPMVVGLFRPLMLMPDLPLSEEELRLILRHELTHVKRHDLWGKALMLLCLTLHWFNPLVYAMARAMASDCEMSCDASVLANADLFTRKYYGEAILGVIRRQRRQQVALSTYFFEGKKNMKKRFQSMLDTTVKRKGSFALAMVLLFSVLSGNVLAVSGPVAGPAVIPAATAQSDAPEGWDQHKTPALFGTNTTQHSENYTTPDTPEITAYSRPLSRAETLRLYDLYYFYDHDGLRAEEPVAVADQGYDGSAFAISAPVAEFAALIPLDKRNEAAFGAPELWADAKEAGLMPFLKFPQRDMNDQELLQLIEAADAFDLLVPYYDPWRQGDEYENRSMTRQERMRYLEIVDRCENDEDGTYRPKNALTNTPNDGLYIKGYNGGGETVYHYPENREMTDEELLQMAWEMVQRRQRSMAEQRYEEDILQEMRDNGDMKTVEPVGTPDEATAIAVALLGLGELNVRQETEPTYNDEKGTWYVAFQEDVPVGAPRYSYSFEVDVGTFTLREANQHYYGNTVVDSYLLGEMVHGTLPYILAADATAPRWAEVARKYLSTGCFYSKAEIASIRSDDSMNNFCVKVDYADGAKAFIFLDAETDALKGYQMITDEEIATYWQDYVW